MAKAGVVERKLKWVPVWVPPVAAIALAVATTAGNQRLRFPLASNVELQFAFFVCIWALFVRRVFLRNLEASKPEVATLLSFPLGLVPYLLFSFGKAYLQDEAKLRQFVAAGGIPPPYEYLIPVLVPAVFVSICEHWIRVLICKIGYQ